MEVPATSMRERTTGEEDGANKPSNNSNISKTEKEIWHCCRD